LNEDMQTRTQAPTPPHHLSLHVLSHNGSIASLNVPGDDSLSLSLSLSLFSVSFLLSICFREPTAILLRFESSITRRLIDATRLTSFTQHMHETSNAILRRCDATDRTSLRRAVHRVGRVMARVRAGASRPLRRGCPRLEAVPQVWGSMPLPRPRRVGRVTPMATGPVVP
jgi:hypothetical protein